MITIIDYGMGNLGSIANMLKYLGEDCLITREVRLIQESSSIILPGVGHFDKAMQNIRELGLDETIRKKALEDKVPIMGICLGMQLMCNSSEEGSAAGLGLIDAEVKKFDFSPENKMKVPHMGWNALSIQKEHPILHAMPESMRFYFVHSYHVVCNNLSDILAVATYGHPFHAAFIKDNICGVQFHPEKSHKYGKQLLNNFIHYC
jgi:glutamine amidotransferase